MYKSRKPKRIEVSLLFWVFWVGLPLLLKGVLYFVFPNGTESVTSNFCCGEPEPRKLHTPPAM